MSVYRFLDVLRLILFVFRRILRILCLADLDFLRLVNLRPPNIPCLSGLSPKLNVSMNRFSLVLGVRLARSAGSIRSLLEGFLSFPLANHSMIRARSNVYQFDRMTGSLNTA